MKKSMDVISFTKDSYRKRLSLVIDDYGINTSKRDVYLVDTPEFKKTKQARQNYQLIDEREIQSPFQVQPHVQKCHSARQRMKHDKVSPTKNQSMIPSPKPKAILNLDRYMQTKTLATQLMTSPSNNIPTNLSADPDLPTETPRMALTQRSSNYRNQKSIFGSTKKNCKQKQKQKINNEINQISCALTKCKQSLENILSQRPKISKLNKLKINSIISKGDYIYNPELFKTKKYTYSARTSRR